MLEHLFLGIVQGVTEFLPISSSGHLALLEQIFGLTASPMLEMLLHLGTLLAVLVYFRERLLQMLLSLVRRDEHLRLVGLLALASLFTAVIAFALKKWLAGLEHSYFMLGIGWLITGTVLFLIERFKKSEKEKITQLSSQGAIAVGIWQGIALLPGISRSGMTISAGLFYGLKRDAAVEFSFLLSIPAVLGATFLEIRDGLTDSTSHPWGSYLLGVLAAFVVGLLSIKGLLEILKTRQLNPFAYYCWALGAIVILWAVTQR
jgi:undecaprenyl-diphosphatase